MAFDIAIVGGGIVGLATAVKLTEARPDLRLVLFEKEPSLGAHQSGHSSGVIHSGLYYKPGSARAQLCALGARQMKAFCAQHGIATRVVGKVVVATSEPELPALEELASRGGANGVPGLAIIDPARLREIEPHAAGIRALHVPEAAIVDYHVVAEKLGDLARGAGVDIRMGARVRGIRATGTGVVVRASDELEARLVVTCGGLHSDRLARAAGAAPGVRIVPFRGEYHTLRPESRDLVRGLVYPVPDPRLPFLGVHLTRTIDGGVEAGPNAILALAREGYRKRDVNLRDLVEILTYRGFWRLARRHVRTGIDEVIRSFSKKAFARSLARLVPEIRPDDLAPGSAGVRAQALWPTGELADDFVIVEGPRSLHVCNAPSPAATASLALGAEIAQRAIGRLA